MRQCGNCPMCGSPIYERFPIPGFTEDPLNPAGDPAPHFTCDCHLRQDEARLREAFDALHSLYEHVLESRDEWVARCKSAVATAEALKEKAAKWEKYGIESVSTPRFTVNPDNGEVSTLSIGEDARKAAEWNSDRKLGALVRKLPEGAALYHLIEHGDIRWRAASTSGIAGTGRATPEDALRAALEDLSE